ncbi:hypothetical protein L798_05332 [Zootermopsis nevadensis]|uniref:Uncharacterized protein n=1 Tax=Zootermopsis nevadensis TaxID=136037 RepID=A0A067RRS2_ZOONE|nr:hypothetical protein L798_05332 [Zootermopsis nevadensis]
MIYNVFLMKKSGSLNSCNGGDRSMGIHGMPPIKDAYINYRVKYDSAAVQR